MLVLENMSLSLAGKTLLKPFSLSLAEGEIVTLMGASGSGKSSLLSFIGGELAAPFTATGKVELNGVNLLVLPPERRNIGRLCRTDCDTGTQDRRFWRWHMQWPVFVPLRLSNSV